MNLGPCDMWQDDSFFFWPNDDSRGTRAATERDAEHLQPLRRCLSPKQPSSLDSQSENQVRLSIHLWSNHCTLYCRSPAVSNTFDPKWEFKTHFELSPDSYQELSIVVFDVDPDNGDTLVGELCLGVDCILGTLKVKTIKKEWLDMDFCCKGQIMISARMLSEENTSVEHEEQPSKRNSMKHEESVRTLEADEEKSRTTSEIRQNQTRHGQALPGARSL